MKTLTLTQPDDWHLHLRDGALLSRSVNDSARQFKRALIMPNLCPPITTIAAAEAYRQRILAALVPGNDFDPLMTLYLTDTMTVETIQQAAAHPQIIAAKLYPAHATTNSAAGVSDIKHIYPLLEAMQTHGLTLCIHGEVTHGDIFDREKAFIDSTLTRLCQDFPRLRMVLEHITTQDAVDFVCAQGPQLAASITPQHLLFHRNQLLAGGIKPHFYCLPVLKRQCHQHALLKAASSGNAKFFLGSDSAPHSLDAKQSACGCAGTYSAYSALEFYAQAFASIDALDKLEAFASFHGADFYRLPRNQGQTTLVEKPWQLPEILPFGDTEVVPLAAGEPLTWQLAAKA